MNWTQQRIRNLIRNCVQMLAAISYDLRTPIITCVKLRAQFVEDLKMSKALTRDINEMEAMINKTLVFARDAFNNDTTVNLDLISRFVH